LVKGFLNLSEERDVELEEVKDEEAEEEADEEAEEVVVLMLEILQTETEGDEPEGEGGSFVEKENEACAKEEGVTGEGGSIKVAEEGEGGWSVMVKVGVLGVREGLDLSSSSSSVRPAVSVFALLVSSDLSKDSLRTLRDMLRAKPLRRSKRLLVFLGEADADESGPSVVESA
jgi:hypothetical protein